MKPAFSIIIFSVLSGAGLGLAFWWALHCAFWSYCAGGEANARAFVVMSGWVFALVTIGVLSSTQHLANPKNAWRAFSRFRSSWLSREGLSALFFFPAFGFFVFSVWVKAPVLWQKLSAGLVVLLSLAVLYSTGMIYACLKTVPQWHTWRTPAKYVLYGLMSGLVFFAAILSQTLEREIPSLLRAAAFALLLGGAFYVWCALTGATREPTLNDALGFQEGRVRLLDVGHSHGTFLTNEFGFRVARERSALISFLAIGLGFVVPFFIVVIESTPSAKGIIGLAALSCIAGLLCERWLFFANARHVVMHYHGQ